MRKCNVTRWENKKKGTHSRPDIIKINNNKIIIFSSKRTELIIYSDIQYLLWKYCYHYPYNRYYTILLFTAVINKLFRSLEHFWFRHNNNINNNNNACFTCKVLSSSYLMSSSSTSIILQWRQKKLDRFDLERDLQYVIMVSPCLHYACVYEYTTLPPLYWFLFNRFCGHMIKKNFHYFIHQ